MASRPEGDGKQTEPKTYKRKVRVEGTNLVGDPDFALLKPKEPFVYISFLSTLVCKMIWCGFQALNNYKNRLQGQINLCSTEKIAYSKSLTEQMHILVCGL